MQLTKRRNVSEISLSLVYEFQLPDANICGGTLFIDGTIILANFGRKKIGLFTLRLEMESWEPVGIFETSNYFFDVMHTKNEIYVTDYSSQCVIVMKSDSYTTVRQFRMQDNLKPYGVSSWNGFLFVACESAILKYSLEGQFIHKYPVESRTIYVTVTGQGHIVYSKMTTNSVTCMDETGQVQWEYKNPKLICPYSVDRDESDNLYVCGFQSNNIHILSSNGKLMKVIEDITCPAFIKTFKDVDMCCVCCNWKNIKIYQIK